MSQETWEQHDPEALDPAEVQDEENVEQDEPMDQDEGTCRD